MHAYKIANFAGTHMIYCSFVIFVKIYFKQDSHVCLNKWTWYHYPQQIQDILDFSWKTLMFLEDWNFDIATNMPAPLNQQMFQASRFLLLLSYSDKCLLERFDAL